MTQDARDPLLEREPDLTTLEHAMDRLGFGSYFDFPDRIPVINPKSVPDDHWKDPTGNNVQQAHQGRSARLNHPAASGPGRREPGRSHAPSTPASTRTGCPVTGPR
jgi:hypothetical protein